jgi:hypothetical protein
MSAELLNPPTPTFDHLGAPHWWACPKCGVSILVYPALPVDHICASYNANNGAPLIDADDADPFLRVESPVAGKLVQWRRALKNGEIVFYPPTEEASRNHYLRYDDRLQRHEELPRHLHRRAALAGRHSA